MPKSKKKIEQTETDSKDKKQEVPESVVFSSKDEIMPISSQTDMMVPVTFAMMKHDFSKIQIRAIINVIKKIQVDLKKLFNMKVSRAILNSRDSSLSIVFNDSDNVEVSPGKYDIIFKMNELASNARNYYDFEDSLKHLADIPVQIPVKIKGRDIGEKEDFIDFTRYTHLCDVSISDKRYKRIVIFSFTPEVAEKFISTDFGYLKLYDSVIMKSGNRYTQLMYMLLSQFRDKETIRIRTTKLRERMNITNKYKEFRKVRSCVLDVAQANLKKLFDEGESDISFQYECEYQGTAIRGQEPDYIRFHIIKRLLISKEDYMERRRHARYQVDGMLRKLGLQDKDTIVNYALLTTPENFFEIGDKLNQIYEAIQKGIKTGKIKDVKAYRDKAIDNLFNDIASIKDVEDFD